MGKMIGFTANGGTTEGYLSEPAWGSAAKKGVIVIQEWWG